MVVQGHFADVRRLFGNKNPEIGITSLMLESVLGTNNINLIPNQGDSTPTSPPQAPKNAGK